MEKYNVTAGVINSKKNSKGLVPIYIFIYQGSKIIKKESISQSVTPEYWNTEKKRVEKKFPNATLINSLIERKISELDQKILEEKVINGVVDINAMLVREKVRDFSFYEFAEKQISEKNYSEETRRNYRIFVEKIRSFRPNLKLREIDFKFLQEYESYLRDTLKNKPNTIWGNMKFLNTISHDAIKMKFLSANPFKTYERPKYKQTERTFLSMDEIKKIEGYVGTTEEEGLKNVGMYFLLMCYSGLRFSDATRLSPDKHIVDDERIVIETQKTKQIANIFINTKIRSALNYTLVNPPVCGQTDFNRKLKLIAAHAGIKKKLSSHVGRHSFGASLVEIGVPEKSAQGLLAHGSAASTKIYYHLQNKTLDEAMRKFDN